MYGLDEKETAAFGRQCLMARRLVEKGVRFVQIFSGGWDSHDYLERGHSARIRSVDKPMAALIKDLKTRGMLDDTLVIWTGEFGRTPDNNKRGGVSPGRVTEPLLRVAVTCSVSDAVNHHVKRRKSR
jgi:uncharacterized protein (DUF1501 family)